MSAAHSDRRQEGLALVSVLWAVSILSLIAASMLSTGTLSYRMERNALNRLLGEDIAEAGITRAVLGLLDSRPDKRWRTDGVPQETEFDGLTIQVSVQDVSGLIDLNEAGLSLLKSLFQSAGIAPDDATTFANRIVDWRSVSGLDEDGAKMTLDRASGNPYAPRKGAFQSVDELLLIPGMSSDLFRRISPALTVYSHQPTIDTLVAPKEALLALPDSSEGEIDKLIANRTQSSAPSSAVGAGRSPGAVDTSISLNGKSFGIKSVVRIAERSFERSAVIRFVNNPTKPYEVLSWR